MKKLIVLFILVMASVVSASPFLVCDVDEAATSYIVVMDSGDEIETPAPLHYDLVEITSGTHVVEVRAKNIWGVSSPSPFEFTKELPANPSNIELSQ